MEPTAYNVTLVIGVMVNGFAGLLLLLQSFFEPDHPPYRRSLVYSAITLWLFAIGFALHVYFQWRTEAPLLASALTLTYFHLGGTLFSWSHIGLIDPFYPSWKIYVRDIVVLAIAIPCYWCGSPTLPIHYVGYAIFVLHCSLYTATLYWKYYHMRDDLDKVTTDPTIRQRTRFMVISCHIIIALGIGGGIVTAFMRNEVWPFTLLMVASSFAFTYIAGSLLLYREVAENVGNAIEDVAIANRNANYAAFLRRVMGAKKKSNEGR